MFSLHFRVCRFKKVIRGQGARAAVARSWSPHCQPGARGTSAALIRGRSTRPPGAGDVSTALVHGRGPLAHRGLLADAPLWHVARVPPGYRQPGTHAPLWRVAGAPLLKKQFSSNINQNCIWLIFDIKCQPKLYLVDV